MSPEEMKRLASREFSAVLAADPVLRELRSHLTGRKNTIPAALDAILLTGGDRIGDLPVLPLTAAKWAFLWVVDDPLVTGKNTVTETELNVFLYVLSCPDLRRLDFALSSLPAEAHGYAAATGLDAETLLREIRAVIANAFSPLGMLPKSGGDPGEVFYDGAWLAWIASIAVRESGMPYDRVIHELPLSLVCNLYVAWRRREGADGDRIRRVQDAEIMDQITARVDELGKEFLRKSAETRNARTETERTEETEWNGGSRTK